MTTHSAACAVAAVTIGTTPKTFDLSCYIAVVATILRKLVSPTIERTSSLPTFFEMAGVALATRALDARASSVTSKNYQPVVATLQGCVWRS